MRCVWQGFNERDMFRMQHDDNAEGIILKSQNANIIVAQIMIAVVGRVRVPAVPYTRNRLNAGTSNCRVNP